MDKIVQTIEKNDKAFVNNRTQNRKENSFVKKNIKAKMKTIISSLPEEQRLIITLYFYEKLSKRWKSHHILEAFAFQSPFDGNLYQFLKIWYNSIHTDSVDRDVNDIDSNSFEKYLISFMDNNTVWYLSRRAKNAGIIPAPDWAFSTINVFTLLYQQNFEVACLAQL